MDWTDSHRQMRDELRRAYTAATGLSDYHHPAFLAWVGARNRDQSGTPQDAA